MPTKTSKTAAATKKLSDGVTLVKGRNWMTTASDNGGHIYIMTDWGKVLSQGAKEEIQALTLCWPKWMKAKSGQSTGKNYYRIFTTAFKGHEAAVAKILNTAGSVISSGYEPKGGVRKAVATAEKATKRQRAAKAVA